MKTPYVDLKLQWRKDKSKLLPLIEKVLSKGSYVIGEEVDKFEKSIAKYCNSKYAVAFNSGTDALTFGLILLGVRKGDEVITPPNSFISSTSSIVHVGAKPVFADVLDDQKSIPSQIEQRLWSEKYIDKKTGFSWDIKGIDSSGKLIIFKENEERLLSA